MKEKAQNVKKDPEAHQTFESWGREGRELARTVVYLKGELKVAVAGTGRDEAAPEAPAEYATRAGRTAHAQIGKAGTRLADQLKKLFS